MSAHLKSRVFRDPVHGDLDFGYSKESAELRLILRLIDTTAFQRLRRIRQNGVMSWVFHGAEHSRFAHSMGVAWLAGCMYDAAVSNANESPNTQDRLDTVLAALLHDVGHGPFSHTLEGILENFDHEHMSARLIAENGSEVARLLREHDTNLPERLLPFIDRKKRTSRHWYYSIVSSRLDADRLDYLVRDPQMAGIFTHSVDVQRLIKSLICHRDGDSTELVVDARARDVLESFLLALDQMYQAVYFHKAVRAASFLLLSTMRRARDLAQQNRRACQALFPECGRLPDPLWRVLHDGPKVDLDAYVATDESLLWAKLPGWSQYADATLRDLVRRVLSRQLPKTRDLPQDLETMIESITLLNRVREETARQFPELEPAYYAHIDIPGRTTYAHHPVGEGSGAAIRVLLPNGTLRAVEDDPRSIVNVLNERIQLPRLILLGEVRTSLFVKGGEHATKS